MAIVSRALIDQRQLAAAIEGARTKLGPEVVQLAYSVGEDSAGDSAIFFDVTLADWAASEVTLTDMTEGIVTTLLNEVQPIENWGLHPYFNFRGQRATKDNGA